MPWLAESHEVSDDGLTYTFHLVKNAKFHNGDPVDAEAVRWSFERTLKLGKGPAWMLNAFLKAEHVSAPDAHTVVFELDRPFAPFTSFLPWWFVMNPKQVMANEVDGDMGQKWLIDNEAGSGPYKLRRVEHGTLYELERVQDYWKGRKGELGGIIYKLIRESAAQRAALIKGEADLVTGLSPDEFDQLTKMDGMVTSTEPALTAFGIKFNTQGEKTSDVNLRKAVAYAFDYDARAHRERRHAPEDRFAVRGRVAPAPAMIRFAAKRGVLVALMLLGLLAITFTISHVAPADPAALAAGPDATLEMIERYRIEHGLDRPLWEQFGIYLRDLLSGDWGRSIHTTRPVRDDLVTYFPNTFELVVFSIVIAIVLGVPLGVLAAVRQNRPVDHVIRVLTVSGVAMPMFWLGLMAQFFFALQLGWFPLGGRIEMMTDPPQPITHLLLVDTLLRGELGTFVEGLHHIVLPAVALCFPALASIIRVNRAEMLETLKQDYIVNARAQGLTTFLIDVVYGMLDPRVRHQI